jgi:predicted RNase H-like HicB family nuclease
MQTFFPTLVEPDAEDGGFGAIVVGAGVLGQGETAMDALRDAGESLQELVWTALERGEPLPAPQDPTEEERARGQIALLQVTMPARAA